MPNYSKYLILYKYICIYFVYKLKFFLIILIGNESCSKYKVQFEDCNKNDI